MRRQVVTRVSDEKGDVVSSVTCILLRAGAKLTTGGANSVPASGTATVRVKHPGALKSGDRVYWLQTSGTTVGNFEINSAPTYNASGYWEVVLLDLSGSTTSIGTTGDLVLQWANSSHYVTWYEDDTTTTGTSGVIFPSSTTGALRFYVDEVDIDIAIAVNGTATYVRDVPVEDRNYVTPEEFGAVGDGVADDSAAMQKALDYVRLGGVTEVRLVGSYLVNGCSVNGANTTVVGIGNAEIKPSGSGKLFTVNANGVQFSGVRFTLGTTHNTPTCFAVYFESVSDGVVRNCYFKDGGYHVEARDVTNFRYIGNTNEAANEWGINVAGCDGVIISDNICFGALKYDGIKCSGNLSGSLSASTHDNVIVTGNVCYDNFRDGIDMAINNGNGIVISGNVCHNNTQVGIDFKTYSQGTSINDVLIEGNNCYSNSVQGINLQKTEGLSISMNRIVCKGNSIKVDATTPGYVGIRCSGIDGVEISGNSIVSGFYGIQYVDGDNGFIVHNVVRDSAYLVYLDAQISGHRVDGNNVLHNQLIGGASTINCVRFSEKDAAGADSIQNNVIAFNQMRLVSDNYRWAAEAVTGESESDVLEDQLYYMNDAGSGPLNPTGSYRGRVGEVYFNSDWSTDNRVLGWICDVQGSSATAQWEEFGFSKTLTSDLSLNGNQLLGNGFVDSNNFASPTTYTALATHTIAQNRVGVNQAIRVKAFGQWTGTNGVKDGRLVLGSTTLIALTQSTAPQQYKWEVEATIVFESTSAQHFFARAELNNQFDSENDYGTASENIGTGSLALKFEAQLASASDTAVLGGFVVEYIGGA